MKKYLLIAGFAALGLAGCGDDSDTTQAYTATTFNPSPSVQISPAAAGVQMNPSTVTSISQTAFNVAYTNGGAFDLGATNPGALFPSFDARHPNNAAASILASFPVLAATNGTTIPGPGGGSITSTVSNTTGLTVTFNNFATANGTISGQVSTLGAATAAGFSSSANFRGVQVFPVNGHGYQIDGPAAFNVTRASATTGATVFASNQVIRDLSNGGTASFTNFLVATTLNSADQSGTQRSSGRITFSGYQGLNGFIDVATVQPAVFQGLNVSAGQFTLTGNGAARLTVAAANTITIEFQNAGTGLWQLVQTVPLAQFLGI